MGKKFRILITISELMYSSQVRNLYDLVSLIDRDRFEIEIGALATGNEAQKEIESLDVPIFCLRLQPTRGFTLQKFKDLLKGPFIIGYKQYDLVHSLLYQSFFTEAFFFKLLTKTKYIYTKSNLEWDNHPTNWRWKSRLTDRIISISNATDELLDEKGFGDKKEKIFLGIDTEHFKKNPQKGHNLRTQYDIPHDALVYGCAAQFVEWKEHLTVLRAFEKLATDHSNIYLLYCGPNHHDSYYDDIVASIQSSPSEDHIRLLGSLSDMPAFYSAIDCFVLPSRFETFGYVYVEAMSCGVPAIGCNAAGPLEIIMEGKTGYFTEMSSPDSLASEMGKYIRSSDLLQQHGAAARQRVIDVFSKEIMAKKTQELYFECLRN